MKLHSTASLAWRASWSFECFPIMHSPSASQWAEYGPLVEWAASDCYIRLLHSTAHAKHAVMQTQSWAWVWCPFNCKANTTWMQLHTVHSKSRSIFICNIQLQCEYKSIMYIRLLVEDMFILSIQRSWITVHVERHVSSAQSYSPWQYATWSHSKGFSYLKLR